MTDQKNGQEYLSFVLEKLQARLAEISQSLLDGQKEIENMHDYYWQNYTEMDQYGYEDYDNQQALSIMIRTPTSVATDVMIVVMLWFSP